MSAIRHAFSYLKQLILHFSLTLTVVMAQAPMLGPLASPLIYRTSDSGVRGRESTIPSTGFVCHTCIDSLQNSDAERRRIENCIEERHPDFDLYAFEFKDSGEATNTAQQAINLVAIRDQLLKDSPDHSGAIVVAFVHGWQHNAKVCDENLTCFRDTLQLVARMEKEVWNQGATPRRVVGVYLSWRGFESVRLEPYRRVDFFTRSWAAKSIGSHLSSTTPSLSFQGLLAQLNHIVGEAKIKAKQWPEKIPSVMLTLGHSFGGVILAKAMEPVVKAALNQLWGPNSRPDALVQGLGDLVVLANPALAAIDFQNTIKLSELPSYSDSQQPIFLSITSESDWATKIAFPAAHLPLAPYLLLKDRRSGAPRGASFKTMGNYKWYVTHKLRVKTAHREAISIAVKPKTSKNTCSCNYGINLSGERLIASLRSEPKRPEGRAIDLSVPWSFGPMELIPSRSIPAVHKRSPVLNILADSAIIDGHGDIFNPNFVLFLVRFISDLNLSGWG